ncbi:hypothetical protein HA402_008598 [Bradysia odoriphaga]|nr:hypothetical protein HA402_008598 [Bradysia odoriphaga]
MSSRKFQVNDEITLYSDDEDGDYLDSNENNRLLGLNDGYHHKNRRRERKHCNPCPTLGIVLMCILVSLYIFLYNVYTSNSPARVVAISGWDRNTTRDTASYVFPDNNTTIIEPLNVCNDKLFLLVIVCSSAVNHETRISSSQLDPSHHNFSVKILFLLGQTPNNETQAKINTESDTYGDVIQESFLDTYNNLTLKTIMMLKWVNRNCLTKSKLNGDCTTRRTIINVSPILAAKFLMKCDDDTFVNIPNLLHVLLGGTVPVYNATIQEYDQHSIQAKLGANRLNQYKELLLGLRFCNSKPIANISSKWYTPMYMYSGNIYPAYLSGTGYVMSMDVVEKLYKTSLSTQLFHLEDVYLTGICAESAKITPRNHQLFSYQSYKNICELKGMITKHEFTSNDIRKAYEFVTNTKAFCPKPDKYFRVRRAKKNSRGCK